MADIEKVVRNANIIIAVCTVVTAGAVLYAQIECMKTDRLARKLRMKIEADRAADRERWNNLPFIRK